MGLFDDFPLADDGEILDFAIAGIDDAHDAEDEGDNAQNPLGDEDDKREPDEDDSDGAGGGHYPETDADDNFDEEEVHADLRVVPHILIFLFEEVGDEGKNADVGKDG